MKEGERGGGEGRGRREGQRKAWKHSASSVSRVCLSLSSRLQFIDQMKRIPRIPYRDKIGPNKSLAISDGNLTEWSTIQGLIGPVTAFKLVERVGEANLKSRPPLPPELHDVKSDYQ